MAVRCIVFLRTRRVPEEMSFLDLVRRVRAGDQQASAELVRRYEPAIRIAVHGRLTVAACPR